MSLQDKASIVLPKGFAGKAGTLECWNPNSDTLVGLSVVRATTATRVNESGLIESVAADVPRRDFINGGCGDLLVEPQRTNLTDESEDVSTWDNTANTLSTNSGVAPDGATTADKVIPTAVSTNHFVASGSVGNVTSGTTYTGSYFVKADGYNFVQITPSTGFLGTDWANFDLANGALASNSLVTFDVDIESYGNGWYRISITGPSNLTTSNGRFLLVPLDSDRAGRLPNWSGNASDGILAWGAQLEQGSYATSYIPTVASAVTRNADVISLTGASALLGDSEGSLFFEFSVFDVSNDSFVSLSDGTFNNRITTGVNGSTQRYRSIVTVGGVVECDEAPVSPSPSSNIFYKYGIRYSLNDFVFYLDGSNIATDGALNTFPDATLNQVVFNNGAGGSPLYGRIRQLVVFDQALTDTQLAAITTP